MNYVTNWIIKYFLASTMILFFSCSFTYGDLTVNWVNHFINYMNPNPGKDLSTLVIQSLEWNNITADDALASDTIDEILTSFSPDMNDPALVYPNPFRLSEGAELGYSLTRSDMDIQLRIYDMRGYEIVRKDYKNGTPGANYGYQTLTLDSAFFDNKPMPSGVYFYVFIYNNALLNKGKFVIEP